MMNDNVGDFPDTTLQLQKELHSVLCFPSQRAGAWLCHWAVQGSKGSCTLQPEKHSHSAFSPSEWNQAAITDPPPTPIIPIPSPVSNGGGCCLGCLWVPITLWSKTGLQKKSYFKRRPYTIPRVEKPYQMHKAQLLKLRTRANRNELEGGGIKRTSHFQFLYCCFYRGKAEQI